MNFQSPGNFDENFDGWGAFSALNSAHIVRMNVCLFRKGFLAQLCAPAIPKHSLADDFIRRFCHRWLRKQKREKPTTHAPCRMLLDFELAVFRLTVQRSDMSRVERVRIIGATRPRDVKRSQTQGLKRTKGGCCPMAVATNKETLPRNGERQTILYTESHIGKQGHILTNQH